MIENPHDISSDENRRSLACATGYASASVLGATGSASASVLGGTGGLSASAACPIGEERGQCPQHTKFLNFFTPHAHAKPWARDPAQKSLHRALRDASTGDSHPVLFRAGTSAMHHPRIAQQGRHDLESVSNERSPRPSQKLRDMHTSDRRRPYSGVSRVASRLIQRSPTNDDEFYSALGCGR